MPFRSPTPISRCVLGLCVQLQVFISDVFNKSYSKQMPRSAAQTFVIKDTQKNYRVTLCGNVIAIVCFALIYCGLVTVIM
jgi:hypothetical protein